MLHSSFSNPNGQRSKLNRTAQHYLGDEAGHLALLDVHDARGGESLGDRPGVAGHMVAELLAPLDGRPGDVGEGSGNVRPTPGFDPDPAVGIYPD